MLSYSCRFSRRMTTAGVGALGPPVWERRESFSIQAMMASKSASDGWGLSRGRHDPAFESVENAEPGCATIAEGGGLVGVEIESDIALGGPFRVTIDAEALDQGPHGGADRGHWRGFLDPERRPAG